MKNKLPWILGLCLVVAVAAGGYYYYSKSGDSGTSSGADKSAGKGGGKGGRGGRRDANVPVVAVPAATMDVGVLLDGLGSVTPIATVTVRSRIEGQLMRLNFKEGQVVREGDLLAEIDSRAAQVQLATAEGTLAKDQALLKNAQLDLERYRTLFKQDSIAKQQLDTQDALVRQYEATLKVDHAAIESARLQLVYSRITAPVSGRIGLRQVDIGNIVRAGDANGIVVITQLQPITVVFSIPEDNLPPVMKKLQAGERLTATAFDRSGKTQLAAGMLITADNQIDPATGTVKLKAQFANEDLALFPNQFVNVRLLVDTKRGATVVPASAVQRGTPGTFVYSVDADTKVANVRKVTLGPTQGELVSVEGIAPGTLVVVDGADRLREGAVVEMVVRDTSPPKEGPRRKRGEKGGGEKGAGKGEEAKGGFEKLSPEERAKRWQELNARIDKGEFGEEIKKLPEEERKQKMRELRSKKQQ
jgi:multidrug efflux system membrane fusion protein